MWKELKFTSYFAIKYSMHKTAHQLSKFHIKGNIWAYIYIFAFSSHVHFLESLDKHLRYELVVTYVWHFLIFCFNLHLVKDAIFEPFAPKLRILCYRRLHKFLWFTLSWEHAFNKRLVERDDRPVAQACGQRSVCDAMSAETLERSDGTLQVYCILRLNPILIKNLWDF